MRKLLYATTNNFKIENMKARLKNSDIELITPKDIKETIKIDETGKTVIENATLKAKAYYDKYKIPTIAGDSALFVEKFDKQPGLYVRRINQEYISDDQLEEYYLEKLKEVGGTSPAYYVTGLALIIKDKLYTIEIKEDEFILTSAISKSKRKADPLGRLEFDQRLNKYFCELTLEDKIARNYLFDKKCRQFIDKYLK